MYYNLALKLILYMHACIQGSSVSYSLQSFICHVGSSSDTGHYIAYVNIKNVWFMLSDANVRSIANAFLQCD